MNRNLLVFGLFLVIAGLFSGYYVLSLFGVLMIVPALRSSSRSPPPPVSKPRDESPRTVMGTTPQMQAPAMQAPKPPPPMPAMTAPSPSPQTQQPGYSPALFPTTLLPSLSLSTGVTQVPSEPVPKSQAAEDDVVKVGAVLALARLLLG